MIILEQWSHSGSSVWNVCLPCFLWMTYLKPKQGLKSTVRSTKIHTKTGLQIKSNQIKFEENDPSCAKAFEFERVSRIPGITQCGVNSKSLSQYLFWSHSGESGGHLFANYAQSDLMRDQTQPLLPSTFFHQSNGGAI